MTRKEIPKNQKDRNPLLNSDIQKLTKANLNAGYQLFCKLL